MHDIDRTQLEFGQEMESSMRDEFEYQEFGHGGPLSEQEEVQFAHELLSVNNEQELEQFLGDFLKKAVSTVSVIARSPIGQAIGGVLKGVAKKALPMAGTALGGFLGGPLGAQIGGGLANAASQAIGLEMEMQESGEFEFEGARQFVRLAADTAQNAVAAAQSGVDPRQAAQTAAVEAASRLAPGLLSGAGTPGAQPASLATAVPHHGQSHHRQSGRWITSWPSRRAAWGVASHAYQPRRRTNGSSKGHALCLPGSIGCGHSRWWSLWCQRRDCSPTRSRLSNWRCSEDGWNCGVWCTASSPGCPGPAEPTQPLRHSDVSLCSNFAFRPC